MPEIIEFKPGDDIITNADLEAFTKGVNDEINKKIESGEYVYIEEVLEMIGFDEFAIREYIRENGHVRWGPNGMEQLTTMVTTKWVRKES